MALLGRDQILSAEDITTEDLYVPEWGGTVRLKALTGTQRDAFEASLVDKQGNRTPATLSGARARLVAQSIVDDKGARIFFDKDIVELGKKSAKALERVFDRAREMNGMSEEDIAEMTENFDEAPGDDSSADSALPLE